MIDGMRLGWRILHQPEVAAGWKGPMVGVTGRVLDQATVEPRSLISSSTTAALSVIPLAAAKMGPDSDKEAVVDQYCRVRGVEGLRVVDASVMPNIVRANTNLTCIMIGERVADWMRAEA